MVSRKTVLLFAAVCFSAGLLAGSALFRGSDTWTEFLVGWTIALIAATRKALAADRAALAPQEA